MFSVHVTRGPDGTGHARITRQAARPTDARRRTWVLSVPPVTEPDAPPLLADAETGPALADLVCRALGRVSIGPASARPAYPGQIRALATLLCSADEDAGVAHLTRLGRATPLARFVDETLAPVLRMLGARWQNDEVSLVDMAVATARIQRYLVRRNRLRAPPAPRHGRALFAALPRQKHLLGLRMAAAAFAEEGWDSDLLLSDRLDDIVARAKATRPRVIGLSAARRHSLPELHRLILRLRALPIRSRILVGGAAAPQLVERTNRFYVDALLTDLTSGLAAAR